MNIYERYMEEKYGPEPQLPIPERKRMFEFSKKDCIYLVIILVLFTSFLVKYIQYGNQLERAQELRRNRIQLIDDRFRESVKFQEQLCEDELQNQKLLNTINELLEFKPYVEIRKQYIDLSLPDAINTFDSTNYTE